MLHIPDFKSDKQFYKNIRLIFILVFSLIITFFNTQQLYANESLKKNKDRTILKKHYTVSYPKITLSNIKIIDTLNRAFELKTELNKGPVIVNFIFTSCTAICPILASTFSQLQKRFDEINTTNINLVSFSIDPEHDTPARLKDYAKQFNAGKQWKFFTGSKANMLKIETIFGNFRGNKMNHLPYTFIRVNKNSQWIRLTGFVKTTDIINEINIAGSI